MAHVNMFQLLWYTNDDESDTKQEISHLTTEKVAMQTLLSAQSISTSFVSTQCSWKSVLLEFIIKVALKPIIQLP